MYSVCVKRKMSKKKEAKYLVVFFFHCIVLLLALREATFTGSNVNSYYSILDRWKKKLSVTLIISNENYFIQ